MASQNRTNNLITLLCVLSGILLSACAHSAGSYDPISPLKSGLTLGQYANLSLAANNENTVPMTAYDRERLINKIAQKLQATNKFKSINSASPETNTLVVTIQITDYDKGNAFLRFLLAGLGQIHIDGKLTLEDRDKIEQLGKYDVSKTFAWGGIYGLSIKIEEVEDGFAETVVEILLEKDKKPDGT
jgi:hypothetical protein